MSHQQLNRRQFVQAAGGIAASASLAGCGGGGNGSDNGEFDVTVRIVNNAPQTGDQSEMGSGDEVSPDVTATQSDALDVTEVIFQRAGPKGLVVAGNVQNQSDHTFEEILVDVTLYDSREVEDNIFDSTSNQSHHDTLEFGDTWRWAVKFRDDPEFTIDYYAVTIKGRYD